MFPPYVEYLYRCEVINDVKECGINDKGNLPAFPGRMRRRGSDNPGYRLDSNRIQRTSGWISDLRSLRALIPACSRSLFNGGTPGKRADKA